ncbi:MAG: YbaN family protein [Phycisphaerales bacterium]|nr:YbaN family protein [Planctomycetota bacterium]MCH8509384.1 YbaN family protein [Phycisphaerales bacterium]
MTAIQTKPDAIGPGADQTARVYPTGVARYSLAGLGLGCVGMGALGVVVPGLPTTIFLIIASWCFARSFPSLTERLIHNRFFGPFLKYIQPGTVMPRKAKIIAAAMMWTAIAISCWMFSLAETPLWIPVLVISAGLVGTWCIARQGRRTKLRLAEIERTCNHPVGRTVPAHKNPACTTTTAGYSKTH